MKAGYTKAETKESLSIGNSTDLESQTRTDPPKREYQPLGITIGLLVGFICLFFVPFGAAFWIITKCLSLCLGEQPCCCGFPCCTDDGCCADCCRKSTINCCVSFQKCLHNIAITLLKLPFTTSMWFAWNVPC